MTASQSQTTLNASQSRPSFIDLRQMADAANAAAAPSGHDGAKSDPFLRCRHMLDTAGEGIAIGVIILPVGSGAVAALPGDEFIIVNGGGLTLTQDGKSLSLAANDSAVLPQGSDFGWKTDQPTTLIFMRHRGGEGTSGEIALIDTAATMQPSNPPLAELLVGPTPSCRSHNAFRSEDGEFTCGIWDSTPYHRRRQRYVIYELMYLLEGSVTFEDETGRSGTFSKGDIFLVEKDAQCSWQSLEHVKKVYAIYRPA